MIGIGESNGKSKEKRSTFCTRASIHSLLPLEEVGFGIVDNSPDYLKRFPARGRK
jgi:hypothetical protein